METVGSVAWLHEVLATYGLWALFGLVFLESTGVPLPGETALITAAIYAGSTHRFNLLEVIGVAFAAAVAGDTMGYLVGRSLGLRLMERYGKYIHLTERRLAVGEYLFLCHGGKIVFFGRFVALLRTMAALLAGANRMPWPRFAVMNAFGGLAWASLFASAAYVFGERISRVGGTVGIGLLGLFLVAAGAAFVLYRRYEKDIEVRALHALGRKA